ncbi:MAG: putative hydroxymethylpyrimidine transport system permease protein [Gaiellales bacterium]|jgi:NitT/TauT family transport system permease protein/putative hydroxymethylpyrimidine transport system permease protein|nr:putative hydroxymethylpyrimidine transport system permease protein [Gaiellales bacterium]MDX6551407.1 putative hydroxymethylpyrimidine transport system permease protein [Gaiellales bacterium]
MRRFGWVLVLAGLLGAWQAWVDLRSLPIYLLPAPSDIAAALWDERSTLGSEALVTMREMLVGFLAAVAAGLAAAILIQRVSWMRHALYPLLVASQSVPWVAVSSLFVIYLGFGLAPKVLIVALVCFFPITANAVDGFASAPRELGRTMQTLNASGRAVFWRIELPWAAPGIFTGARIAASYAAVAALFSEYAGGSGGLVDSMHDHLDTGLVGAAIVLLAALSLGLFGLVTLIERIVLPWSREG